MKQWGVVLEVKQRGGVLEVGMASWFLEAVGVVFGSGGIASWLGKQWEEVGKGGVGVFSVFLSKVFLLFWRGGHRRV